MHLSMSSGAGPTSGVGDERRFDSFDRRMGGRGGQYRDRKSRRRVGPW